MPPAILALGTAVPPYIYSQEEIADQFIHILDMDQEKQLAVKRIYQHSAIEKRHSILADFQKQREEWDFWGTDYPRTVPGMSERNLLYKQEAPRLAKQAALQALERWGGDLSQITHVISVSCTGAIAPGIEFYLMQEFGLSPTVNRLSINFMGCFGAFKGLSVARAFAQENPDHRILVVCTELCSLHLQASQDSETLVGNSLFADGSAAVIVGNYPKSTEKPLWNIIKSHSMGIEDSLERMSWEAGDSGFFMRLSPAVPVLIRRHIKAFVQGLLPSRLEFDQCDWAIHPGGKSIIQAVERALELESTQTLSSWNTLANYGNMSSATFLFVLDHLSRQAQLRPWSVGIAFGPGLSFEGLLLQTEESSC